MYIMMDPSFTEFALVITIDIIIAISLFLALPHLLDLWDRLSE